MATRRITPSFVAGFVGGAVLACLVSWGVAAWSLSHDQQKFARAFSMQLSCTGGSDDYRLAHQALAIVDTLDEQGPDAAREKALRSADHHATLLGYHQGEHPRSTAELGARIARARGEPYDAAIIHDDR